MSQCIRSTNLSPQASLEICQGDITLEAVDAVVNAANAHLIHGGGVAAAIARRAGLPLDKESREWVQQHGPVTHTAPALTSAGAMPARYVIHAVGPIWGEGSEEPRLAETIHAVLALASQNGFASLAFPAISTGIYGFPKQLAAPIFFNTIQSYFTAEPESSIKLVRIVLYDQATLDAFLGEFDRWTANR
ncbi:hypothetical protein ADN00_13165 [Ornatilinea apprima]|uniref:Macro domain-containing protein n=1 Tax=Ornatilinea apprima TaxID=1134406 RepID=A0A0P6XI56_9CHLR|nr:macro domain-containing protein [Ornatilinea apprima]KPL75179.1 hypothetical protein ADN00_13165 [Ornatilinea apprima]